MQPEGVDRLCVEAVLVEATRTEARVGVPIRVVPERHDPTECSSPVSEQRAVRPQPQALLVVQDPDLAPLLRVLVSLAAGVARGTLARAAGGARCAGLFGLRAARDLERVDETREPAVPLGAVAR